MSVSIEQIPVELTWRIRREAMYPDKHIDEVKLSNDADGIHFGLFFENSLCSVVSLFISGNTAQFRKFATLPIMQGQGLGTKLLQYIIAFGKTDELKLLWCNARVTAIDFYKKQGFKAHGDIFRTGDIEYIKLKLAYQ